MTPRKWTSADVTGEDLAFLREGYTECSAAATHLNDLGLSWIVAACWNRLEEKRASDCGPVGHLRKDVLLRQALEALRSGKQYLRHDKMCVSRNQDIYDGCDCGMPDVFLLMSTAIAALEKEVGA